MGSQRAFLNSDKRLQHFSTKLFKIRLFRAALAKGTALRHPDMLPTVTCRAKFSSMSSLADKTIPQTHMVTLVSLLRIKDLEEHIATTSDKPWNPISPSRCPTPPFTQSTEGGCEALLILGAPEPASTHKPGHKNRWLWTQRITHKDRGLWMRLQICLGQK